MAARLRSTCLQALRDAAVHGPTALAAPTGARLAPLRDAGLPPGPAAPWAPPRAALGLAGGPPAAAAAHALHQPLPRWRFGVGWGFGGARRALHVGGHPSSSSLPPKPSALRQGRHTAAACEEEPLSLEADAGPTRPAGSGPRGLDEPTASSSSGGGTADGDRRSPRATPRTGPDAWAAWLLKLQNFRRLKALPPPDADPAAVADALAKATAAAEAARAVAALSRQAHKTEMRRAQRHASQAAAAASVATGSTGASLQPLAAPARPRKMSAGPSSMNPPCQSRRDRPLRAGLADGADNAHLLCGDAAEAAAAAERFAVARVQVESRLVALMSTRVPATQRPSPYKRSFFTLLSTPAVRAECVRVGADASGHKPVLVERLIAIMTEERARKHARSAVRWLHPGGVPGGGGGEVGEAGAELTPPTGPSAVDEPLSLSALIASRLEAASTAAAAEAAAAAAAAAGPEGVSPAGAAAPSWASYAFSRLFDSDEVAALMADSRAEELVIVAAAHQPSASAEQLVIGSARNERHARQVAARVHNELSKRLSELLPGPPPCIEGDDYASSPWLVVDCGSVVAHILTPAARAQYALEAIWGGPDGQHLRRYDPQAAAAVLASVRAEEQLEAEGAMPADEESAEGGVAAEERRAAGPAEQPAEAGQAGPALEAPVGRLAASGAAPVQEGDRWVMAAVAPVGDAAGPEPWAQLVAAAG